VKVKEAKPAMLNQQRNKEKK